MVGSEEDPVVFGPAGYLVEVGWSGDKYIAFETQISQTNISDRVDCVTEFPFSPELPDGWTVDYTIHVGLILTGISGSSLPDWLRRPRVWRWSPSRADHIWVSIGEDDITEIEGSPGPLQEWDYAVTDYLAAGLSQENFSTTPTVLSGLPTVPKIGFTEDQPDMEFDSNLDTTVAPNINSNRIDGPECYHQGMIAFEGAIAHLFGPYVGEMGEQKLFGFQEISFVFNNHEYRPIALKLAANGVGTDPYIFWVLCKRQPAP